MLCASHQPAALCEFFFITTSSLLRIYELIVSEDEGFVKNFLPRVSAFLPANSLNLSTDLKSRSRHPKKDVYLVLVYGITEHPMMLVTNTITLLLFTHLLYHRLKMLCHL